MPEEFEKKKYDVEGKFDQISQFEWVGGRSGHCPLARALVRMVDTLAQVYRCHCSLQVKRPPLSWLQQKGMDCFVSSARPRGGVWLQGGWIRRSLTAGLASLHPLPCLLGSPLIWGSTWCQKVGGSAGLPSSPLQGAVHSKCKASARVPCVLPPGAGAHPEPSEGAGEGSKPRLAPESQAHPRPALRDGGRGSCTGTAGHGGRGCRSP